MLEPRRVAAGRLLSGWRPSSARRRAAGSATASGASRGGQPDRGGDRGHPDPDGPVRRRAPGIGCLIFDEFHERALQADLGLASPSRSAPPCVPTCFSSRHVRDPRCRPRGGPDGDAPILDRRGARLPVETRWLDRPRSRAARLEDAAADLVLEAPPRPEGRGALLPGQAEIARTAARLCAPPRPGCPAPAPAWRSALRRAARCAGRRSPGAASSVPATAIAETSLTIPDIRWWSMPAGPAAPATIPAPA